MLIRWGMCKNIKMLWRIKKSKRTLNYQWFLVFYFIFYRFDPLKNYSPITIPVWVATHLVASILRLLANVSSTYFDIWDDSNKHLNISNNNSTSSNLKFAQRPVERWFRRVSSTYVLLFFNCYRNLLTYNMKMSYQIII